jgi:hypothetical protein
MADDKTENLVLVSRTVGAMQKDCVQGFVTWAREGGERTSMILNSFYILYTG